MKYYIHTYGCQMNNRDSETIAGMLQHIGYEPTNEQKDADVIIMNTCCVRESAENKIYGHIGELTHLKNNNPDLIVGVCGCMAQEPGTAEKIKKSYPHVDLVFGTHNLHQLPELLARVKQLRQPIFEVWDAEGGIVENLPARREDGIKAWVTITYGCNNFCTYCIVPYVRGRERSRSVADVVAEVTQLGREGFKEVTLLGQNVNSYGKDLANGTDFADLLMALDKIDEIARIRYMTSHPRDFTDKLIDVIANAKKVAEQFHLPVQSGSSEILQKMNRGYTREQYLTLVNKIRARLPEAGITTDIIVGFPGETAEEFAETMSLVEKIRYDAAFTFVYNKRSGTPAAKMADQIPDVIKKQRITELLNLQSKITMENNLAQVGKIKKVLVEGPGKNDPGIMVGRAGDNRQVSFSGDPKLLGQIVEIKIISASTWNLDGELIK